MDGQGVAGGGPIPGSIVTAVDVWSLMKIREESQLAKSGALLTKAEMNNIWYSFKFCLMIDLVLIRALEAERGSLRVLSRFQTANRTFT